MPRILPIPNIAPFSDVGLVDGVRDRAAHAHVVVRLLRVVHGHDDVVRGVADDHLEARVLLEIGDVLGAEPEHRGVDVAGLERGQHRVGIRDEAVGHAIELRQALDVVVGVLREHDAVAAHPLARTVKGPVPIGALFSVSTASRG